jgi:hypothetical protein
MNTIFESTARQPSEASVERELNVLKEEIAMRQEEINTEPIKHINFKDDDEVKIHCINEVVSVTLGDNMRTNKNKVTAVNFELGITEGSIKDICAKFKIKRQNYYSSTNHGFDLSQKSLINTMNERHLRLYKYFTVTIHQLMEHPITQTFKSQV